MGTAGPTLVQYAARTGQYKLIVINDFQQQAFYDLGQDPFEQFGPLPYSELDDDQKAAADSLYNYLTNQLLPPDLVLGICPEGMRNGDACSGNAGCCSYECVDLGGGTGPECVTTIPSCGTEF